MATHTTRSNTVDNLLTQYRVEHTANLPSRQSTKKFGTGIYTLVWLSKPITGVMYAN